MNGSRLRLDVREKSEKMLTPKMLLLRTSSENIVTMRKTPDGIRDLGTCTVKELLSYAVRLVSITAVGWRPWIKHTSCLYQSIFIEIAKFNYEKEIGCKQKSLTVNNSRNVNDSRVHTILETEKTAKFQNYYSPNFWALKKLVESILCRGSFYGIPLGQCLPSP